MTPVSTSRVIFTGYTAEEGLGISISNKTLEQVKAGALDEGNIIKRIWNAVREFFSPSDRVEAKLALIDFYSESSTDQTKIESFYRLKELAGSGNDDFLTPEVSYHAKPEGGFYKIYDLKIKIDGLDVSIERSIERDCSVAEEIFDTCSSSIWKKEDRELFEHCINALYPSAEFRSTGTLGAVATEGAILNLYGVLNRNPDVGIVVDLSSNSIAYKGSKLPPLGPSGLYDPALHDLNVGAAIKEKIRGMIDPHRPASIRINQKDEAIKVLHQILELHQDGPPRSGEMKQTSLLNLNDIQDEGHQYETEISILRSPEEERDEVLFRSNSYFSPEFFEVNDSLRELLGVIYSHRSSVEEKNHALLKLSTKLNDPDKVKFEISELDAGRVGELSLKITKIRMSFPENEQLDSVEIAKTEFIKRQKRGDVEFGNDPQYVPWAGGWSSTPSDIERTSSGGLPPSLAPTDAPIRPMGINPWIKS
ncbi:MAG: hypothetical protein I8H77_09470 [Comamonadaceae bacterium]|nr:hypothetical protein [Comamonadaceae bacterium]